ncbi:MAG: sigma-70 family RNA polymerase sigma factor [Patescibacteria group bacterium]|nr:sigma-70 family RNA polymerase sigma factor [Patescibacteria group bacterium]
MIDGHLTNEVEILKQAIAGESSAFGLLYDKYQPPIFRFIYLKVSHREEAEDLTHQVFLSAWENISSFQEQGLPISSWLYQIARNRVIDYYRTKHTTIPIEDIDEESHAVMQDMVGTVHNKIQLEHVHAALRSLHPDQQDVIIMRFVEGLSNAETAIAIGKHEGTVRVLQHRALRNLKKEIQKNEQQKHENEE